MEQKNYSVVRRNVGYLRYDSDHEFDLIQKLYSSLNLYVNYFLPNKKLVKKIREGSKEIRKYDTPRTPLQRLRESGMLAEQKERLLIKKYRSLNPAELKRNIAGNSNCRWTGRAAAQISTLILINFSEIFLYE